MILDTHRSDTKPWYQHRWPWILMCVPAVSVIVGIILLVTAFNNPAILVVDNYYAEGRGINQSLAMDHAAEARGLQAHLALDGERLTLQLSSDQPAGVTDEALRLYVYHATHEERDREFLLVPALQRGVYEIADAEAAGSLATLLRNPGAWYFELRGVDNDWRLRQRIQTPVTQAAL